MSRSYGEEMSNLVVDEEAVLTVRPKEQRGVMKLVAVGTALVLAVVATAAATTVLTLKMSRPVTGLSSHVAQMEDMMVVNAPAEECATWKDDCLPSRCCAATGFNCFKREDGKGACMKECTPGGANGTCEGVAPHMAPIKGYSGLSFFCFAVYTENTGSDKPNHEWELLQTQYNMGISLFSCADWQVFSDVPKAFDSEKSTTVVEDKKGDFHIMKRKETGCWVNTGMFAQVWAAVKSAGKYSTHNWVVKVDADAVFFPDKLGDFLRSVPEPPTGLYIENCKYVDWGYFGNLEVMSKIAFQTLVDNIDTCYDEIDWKTGIQGGKYGAMGEDLFAQQCMDHKKVAKIQRFDLSTDGACEADRPADQKKNKKYVPECAGVSTPSIHPFKKVDQYVACYNAAKDAK